MVSLYDSGICLANDTEIVPEPENGKVRKLTGKDVDQVSAGEGIIAYSILEAHNTSGDMEYSRSQFGNMASYDIIFVGIVQTIKVSGMEKLPILHVLINCRNTLCVVGETINEDNHMFGPSVAKKYGGIYVPLHIAVVHQYMRGMMARCSRMILGSDSHIRYRVLGATIIGEGGGEPIKQLSKGTYDVVYPGVTAVCLDGAPQPGAGPQDTALAIIRAAFKSGYTKSKVMEFAGPSVASMMTDYHNGTNVMTTEATCLSPIWKTDDDTKAYLARHHREKDCKEPAPVDVAHYNGCVYVDLSTVRPMIALPSHLNDTCEIGELKTNLNDILGMVETEATKASGGKAFFTLGDKVQGGQLMVWQAVIVGYAGGIYSNMTEATHVSKGKSCGYGEFSLAVYPPSQPVFADLVEKGAVFNLMDAGAVIRTTFCGPCFGAGDTPCNNGLNIRHTARNFPNREGSKLGSDQTVTVVLIDAYFTVAAAVNRGRLTLTRETEGWGNVPEYEFNGISYKNQVHMGYNKGDGERELVYGSDIKNWPGMNPLAGNILLKICSKTMNPVTTADKLVLFGETSPYRSNPLGLAGFTLSRRNSEYVGRAREVDNLEKARIRDGAAKELELGPALGGLFDTIRGVEGNENVTVQDAEVGGMTYTVEPGDGSVREQAASCQRTIGDLASICKEYATKRYRSNVMNRGMVPFQMEEDPRFEVRDYIYVPDVREVLDGDLKDIEAHVLGKEGDSIRTLDLYIADMTVEERDIVKTGCLISYNRGRH